MKTLVCFNPYLEEFREFLWLDILEFDKVSVLDIGPVEKIVE